MLQTEAEQCCTFLGQDLDRHLAVPIQGIGEGSVDGKTRGLVVQQREELRGAILKEALEAWSNRDKLSTSWLQCLTGPDGLSSQAFSEAMTLLLSMPSPACKDRIGAKVVKKRVDIFGDSIMSEVLPAW